MSASDRSGDTGDNLELVAYPDTDISGRADVLTITSKRESIEGLSGAGLLVLQESPTGPGSKNVVLVGQIIDVRLNQPCVPGKGC